MDWIIANWKTIIDVIAYTVFVASIIVRFTPSDSDNKFLNSVIRILELLSLYKRPVE